MTKDKGQTAMKGRYLFSACLVLLLTLILTSPLGITAQFTRSNSPPDKPGVRSELAEGVKLEPPQEPQTPVTSPPGKGERFDPKKWPIDVGAVVNSSPVLGDLDGDGCLEIIIGSDNGKVYAWKADGTPLPGWPVSTGDSVRSSPALADLDGDGKLEVIVGSFDGKIYAWNFRGSLVLGWPVTTGSVIYSSPAIGDVDGDQSPEVVVGSFDNKVYVWNADGSLARGWPQSTGLFVYSSPALADLDGDGKPEIIIGSDNNQVFIWNGEGIPLAGWPQVTGHVVPTSPAVGDIDGDGELDIIAGSWDKVYAWDSHGKLKPGWPITVGSWVTSSPALADLDNDGLPDIIVGSKDGKVYAWNGKGKLIDGWPTITDGEITSSPAVGDVDGDGRLEVVIGSKDNKLYIWDMNGKLLPGWPKATGGPITSSPAIGDLDKDGNIEVVVGSRDHKVYVWSIPGSGRVARSSRPDIPWAGFHRDPQHTGFLGQTLLTGQVAKTLRPSTPVSGAQPTPNLTKSPEAERSQVPDTALQSSLQRGPEVKREEPATPPVVAKPVIEDLTISDFTDTTVTLTWTAPSVKGNPAKFYDIRFSGEPITEETWEKATKYTTDLHPSSPGQPETFVLINLPPREKLYLAIRASDGKDKTKLSNVVELDRLDTIPPGAIKDLVVVEKGEQLELTWTAPGDNGYEGSANAYDIRYASQPLSESSWSKAAEIIGEPKPLPAGTKQQFLIPKPATTEVLYFGIKTIDEALNISPLSNIATWTPQDKIPPAKIQDLRVENITPEGIILTWTAPGDDGNVGRAFRYDIRYSESPITDANWSSIKNLIIGPIPEAAGTLQRFIIKEPLADKIYYFAMKTVDKRGNESPLSNILQVDVRDKIAPAPIKDLVVMEVGSDWARLSWTATGDNGTEGTAAAYSLRYAEDPKILEAWDQAQEAKDLPKPLPSGSKEEFKLSGLKSNLRYYVAIKAIDGAGNYSAISNLVEVKTSDTINPDPITDLRATGSTEDSVTLSWTATGDDGRTGKAARYDLRYTVKEKLTKNNWDQANKLTGLPQPAESGKPEIYIVRNLARDTVYYFAIEAIDKQGNRSGLSNVLEVSTSDTTPPAAVTDLAVQGSGADWVRVSWTATGDDGTEGQASFYSLRYAESLQTVQEWDRATEIPNMIKPGKSGSKEEFTISGLKSNTVYHLAIKVGDDRGNLSRISNIVQARTADTINPAPIADLRVTSSTEDSITLSWTATGDDGRVGRAAAYDLRFTQKEKLTKENWPLAEKIEHLPKPAESGSTETFSITGLVKGTPYYFAIEAIDAQGNRSGLSNVVEITTKDVTPPAPIKDLSVVRTTGDSVELSWTATGDDGTEGVATAYSLKYALDRKTLEEWNQATEAFSMIKPARSGEKEKFTLTGLKSNVVYYIGLKAIDEAGNTSGLSNIVQAKTQDTISPDPIVDLRVVANTESSITLSWTATGDDGKIGRAASYDLRFTVKSTPKDKKKRESGEGVLTKDNWTHAVPVTGLPQPGEAGKTETFTVTGLSKNSTYYFAIEAIDKQGNRSGLSNVIEVSTSDTTPPATVQTLAVMGAGADWIRLTWIATGDDGMEGRAASYSLRYAETAAAIKEWDHAPEVPNMIRPGNPGDREEFIITGGLKSNTTYYIGLKVRDSRGNTSGLSNIVQAKTSDALSPAPITDLRVVESTEDSVTLSWTATGDDGRVGQASEYDLRYTLGEKLSRNLWPLAHKVEGLPRPLEAGRSETFKVTGLKRHTTYYFGLEAVDNQGNRSGISNILEVSTRDLTPPAAVTDLAIVSTGPNWVKVSWTATGDDGTEGQAAKYSLRYLGSTGTELKPDPNWWDQAVEVSDVPKPAQPGTKEEFTITGLNSNTTYFIGLKIFDGQNNVSPLSNILRTRTADTIKPALITDLAPVEVGETLVTLKWTATGDDGKVGRAERYDLRYMVVGPGRGSSLTPKTWQTATEVPNLPQPSESGTVEVVTVAGLSRDTKYNFAIEAIDGAGNRSGLSNIIEVVTLDTTPPASVTDLKALETGPDWVRLSWTATGDDGIEGTASRYSLRYATDLKTLENWEKATEAVAPNRMPLPKSAGTSEEFLLKGLKSNTTYYIALRVLDNRQNISGLSNIVEVRTADALSPGVIEDLQVVESTEDSITLSWTATGDDGRVGQANEYDLRYTSGEKLTKTSWKLAHRVTEVPKPQPSGSMETYKVTGLSRDTVYYFGIEAIDKQGNRSGISNIVEIRTQDLTPPAGVVDLAVIGAGADWVKISWTATGDDGTEGQATAYSLRYAGDLKTLEEWDHALEVPGVPKPAPSGTKEVFTITGLKNNSTYYIGLKVMDNRQNFSPLSNILTVQTADTINPAPITDLRVAETAADSITLSWTATGDDDRVGRAATYDFRYSTVPLTEKTWASAQKVPNPPTPAEAGTIEKLTVRGLVPNQIYYFGVLAIDKNSNISPLSNIVEASTADTLAPKAITDLSIEETTENSVSLVWTSVGDDPIHKTAARYDLRYSTNPITEGNWSQATRVSPVIKPSESGTKERQVVTNLRKGTSYYFAIKSIDNASNVSPLSNTVWAYTLPDRITDLAVGKVDKDKVTLTWTTPGGDLTGITGTEGRFYEIRYAKQEITEDNWSQATLYPARIKAKEPGSQEQVVLTNLPPDEKLFFAVKVFKVGGPTVPGTAGVPGTGISASQISNKLEVNRLDIIPPAAITDLVVRPITCQSPEGQNLGSRVPDSGPEKSAESKKQSKGKQGLLSFTKRKSNNLRSESPGSELRTLDCLELSWTATGDNGHEGTATAYDIRYARTPLDETNWVRAERYLHPPTPQAAGTPQTFIVPLPSQEETFFFAIKVLDEALNISPISNVVSWTPPDHIPPAAITDLKVTSLDSHTITLSWTAPGNNENRGKAAFYDIRYCGGDVRCKLPEGWSKAQTVAGEPLPEEAGTLQSMTLTNLISDTTYYIAMTATDGAGNTSPLSNIVEATTPDVVAPSPVKDLSVVGVGLDRLKLAWTATGDDGEVGQASQYSLKYATDRATLERWDSATEVPKVPAPKSAGKREEFLLTGLTHNTTYYIGLKVIDNRGNYSGLSNILEARTGDAIGPEMITDLKVIGKTSSPGTSETPDTREERTASTDGLTLSWTAPGDDGKVGQADKYEIRYSIEPLNPANWNKATKVKEVPKPSVAGTVENLVIRGLAFNKKYYFGIIAVDKSGNPSPLSNIAEGFTRDTIPPQPVRDLQVESTTKDTITLTWTAPKDDALHDQAFAYDLRYSIQPFGEGSNAGWETAERVQGIPQPGNPGALERFTIGPAQGITLQENTPYYFAIKVIDQAGNVSPLSNIVSTQTKDVTPPVAIGDLVAAFPTRNTITLIWTAPQDPNTGKVASYEIRYWEVKDTDLEGTGTWGHERIETRRQGGQGTPGAEVQKSGSGETPELMTTEDVPPSKIEPPGKKTTEKPEAKPEVSSGKKSQKTSKEKGKIERQGPEGTGQEGSVRKPSVAASKRSMRSVLPKPEEIPEAKPKIKPTPSISGQVPGSGETTLQQGGIEVHGQKSQETVPTTSRSQVTTSRIPFPWEKAVRIPTPPQPSNPGSVEKYVVANLKEGQTYAFAIRSTDPSGNISELSNVVVEMTLGPSLPVGRPSISAISPEKPIHQGQWSTYQGKGTILSEDNMGIQVTSTDRVFGIKRPLVVSYPAGNNTVTLPQDQLSLKIKSREPFIVYIKVMSTQKDEYYLAYQASTYNGLWAVSQEQRLSSDKEVAVAADNEQGTPRLNPGQTMDHGPQITDNRQQTMPDRQPAFHRVDNFVFFRLGSEFLDGNWHNLERNLRKDLFEATGQNYLATKWFAVRGTQFSLGDVNLAGKLVKTISVSDGGTAAASWGIHYGEGDLSIQPDSELNKPVLQAKSRTGRELVIAYPVKPGIQITEKILSAQIKAREEFKFFVKVVTSTGETYYLTYIPREGPLTVSGNYIYVPIGTSYRDGTWHKLEQNLEADLKKALESSGQPGTNYSYTNWISIGGREFSLNDIQFSTEEMTEKILK
ncbi:MAG TPA: fibronectin type III domain-containing protein [Candidatus Limnocylindrales bacterium]|nr:fibronectin type III domain-containing protein [Candidatus Limnocylindrales bacterium]